jgi:CheY-like chemotaxis protein
MSSFFSLIKLRQSSRKGRPLPPPERPFRVLVVDDEEPVRKFVERIVAHGHYQTRMAADGPDAMAIAEKEGPFDLLLTDLIMPGMNGDELARRLREQQPTLKVLYLTGFSDRLFKERMTLHEGEAFLDKPCSVKALLQAISLLLFGRFVDLSREIPSATTSVHLEVRIPPQ